MIGSITNYFINIMKRKENQLKIGSLLTYIQMMLSVIIGLIYTPVMIRLLGQSEYGLYNTVSSVMSMLSLLSIGFGSGYIRYYSKYKKENDDNSIFKLNGLYLIVFLIIGVVALFCGLFLSFNLNIVFDSGLTVQEYETAKILMIVLTVNLALSFPASVFSNIISAHEKFIFLKLINAIRVVISPLVTLPLLLMGYGSIALVVITTLISIITDCIFLFYVLAKLNQKFIFRGYDKSIFRTIFSYTIFVAIHLIVDQINWNVDKMLLGRFKGTDVVAIYSVGFALYQYYLAFSLPVSNVFVPRVHHIVSVTENNIVERKQRITELFVKVGRVQFIILSLILTGLVFFGKPFIYYWAGGEYSDAYYVLLLLAIPGTIDLIQNIGIEIQRAQNKHKARAYIYLCMALINILLSIFLCQKYGAIGSAVGTAISLIVANGIIIYIYYQKECNINIVVFWGNIGRACVGLIIPIVVGICMMLFIDLFVIWKLILCIILYTIIYVVSMWFLGMNKYEKDLVLKPLKKFFNKE